VTGFMLLAQADADNGGVIGGQLALGAVFWILAIIATIFWLWMLVDVLMSSKPANEKILWFLVVFFLHLIGALIYFFVGRNRTAGTVTGPV
jgi:hypothetical protein